MAQTMHEVLHSWLDNGTRHTTPDVNIESLADTVPQFDPDDYLRTCPPNDILVDTVLTTDTSIYASGDVLADQQNVIDALRISGGRAILQSVEIIDHDNQAGALDLIFLASGMSIGVENSTAAVTGSILKHVVAIVPVASANYVAMGGAQVAIKGIADLGFVVTGNQWSKDLYVAAVSRDTKTYSATGLELKTGFTLRN